MINIKFRYGCESLLVDYRTISVLETNWAFLELIEKNFLAYKLSLTAFEKVLFSEMSAANISLNVSIFWDQKWFAF